MATLDELRATLIERESHAPDPSSFVLSFAGATRSRSRVLAPAFAAAAVLCLAMASVWIGRAVLSPTPDGAAGSVSPRALRWSFSVGAVPGFVITRNNWSAMLESATIASADPGGPSGLIEIHAAGTADDSSVEGRRVSVLGHRAVFQVGGVASALHDPDSQPMLVWEYADNAWAELGGTFGYHPATGSYDQQHALAMEERIATKLTFTASDAVTAPFQASPPRELTPQTVVTSSDRTCVYYDRPGRLDSDGGSDAALIICRVRRGAAVSFGAGPDDVVVARDLDDGTRLVLVGAAHTTASLSRSEITAIANDADVSPRPDDSSSWLPVYSRQ